jgi:hypothetical protein
MKNDNDEMDVPVQCGSCYQWYDALENVDGEFPLCGSDEIVGDR